MTHQNISRENVALVVELENLLKSAKKFAEEEFRGLGLVLRCFFRNFFSDFLY